MGKGATVVGDLGGGVGLGVLNGANVGDLSRGAGCGVGLGVLKGANVGDGLSGTAGVGGGNVGMGGSLGSLGALAGKEANCNC